MAILKPFDHSLSTRSFLLFIAVFFFFSSSSPAQDRCGTIPYTQKLKNLNRTKESDAQFEQWLQKKISSRRHVLDSEGRVQATTYQVPVVIHVIHNGEALGDGTNIPDAQIISQIAVLNNDFQRLNADAINTPAEFASVAGSMSLEFVLAKQDPNGLATNGIVRVQGTKTTWTVDDNDELKSMSYWPAEDYFNIWVCNLDSYLGYTQFPVSTLAGLEDSSNNRLTDGVVIGNLYFGTVDAGSFNLAARYNKGRTVTHEVGHFFGLRHIWGDIDNCGGTDYVDDTPNQRGSTPGCPSNPQAGCVANAHKMFQNYMDYTDDACMNLYTRGQVTRMTTVIEQSPRRVTLTTSHGLQPPSPVPNDLGVREITSPNTSECDLTITPAIQIQNFGNNTITAANIQLLINLNPAETKPFSGNLAPGESTTIGFSPQLRAAGKTIFSFKVLNVNTGSDGNPFNDTLSVRTTITLPISVPFTETFTTLPTNWTIQNPDQLKTWALKAAPFKDAGNKAMYIDYYDYSVRSSPGDHTSEQDVLISPPFDLSSTSIAYLSFDEAYAQFDGSSSDGLRVIVITGCGTDIFSGTKVYEKIGSDLATVAKTTTSFTPKSENDWRTEVINLSSFVGNNRVRLAFVGINGNGNNLYLDNVSIITNTFDDLAISKVLNPAIVTCPTPSPKLEVTNVGTTVITDFKVQYAVNSGGVSTVPVIGKNLKPGENIEVDIPAITLSDGTNTVTFTITSPNTNGVDINPDNSHKTVTTFSSTATDRIPLRENFDDDDTSGNWTIVNPGNGKKWTFVNTETETYGKSVFFNSSTVNDQAWLVSPLLDFSHTAEASVFFDLSNDWDGAANASDQLLVLASAGCGNTFDDILYESSGQSLSTTSLADPKDTSDWRRKFIDLSQLAGQRDIRIAFAATHLTSASSNGLYIDNIEFYNSIDTVPPVISSGRYAIYTKPNDPVDFYITFNLKKKATVGIDVVDVMGQPVISDILGDVLNETYPVTLNNTSTGIYIVRLRTNGQYSSTKVFVKR